MSILIQMMVGIVYCRLPAVETGPYPEIPENNEEYIDTYEDCVRFSNRFDNTCDNTQGEQPWDSVGTAENSCDFTGYCVVEKGVTDDTYVPYHAEGDEEHLPYDTSCTITRKLCATCTKEDIVYPNGTVREQAYIRI